MESVRLSTASHLIFYCAVLVYKGRMLNGYIVFSLTFKCSKAKARELKQCQSSSSFSKHCIYECVSVRQMSLFTLPYNMKYL